ncbi:hypothetical protein MtrunA17_Chr8g0335031 [Medicago truncatula]|uniref:Uncharacterized protein n=1 Tax=Medicago truncatula TaxID=3880 RepID=A0A396G9S7_MEDTR|nr:hypothetical protein MtrunA17_Chr8g0335031 [Medicago truncatula]
MLTPTFVKKKQSPPLHIPIQLSEHCSVFSAYQLNRFLDMMKLKRNED